MKNQERLQHIVRRTQQLKTAVWLRRVWAGVERSVASCEVAWGGWPRACPVAMLAGGFVASLPRASAVAPAGSHSAVSQARHTIWRWWVSDPWPKAPDKN